MSITRWNPATTTSRGNIAVGIVPAVVNINKPTVSEINVGIGLDCAITSFNGSSSVDSESVDWLCDPASESIPGSISHSIDDVMVKVSGQEDDTLISNLNIGDVVYVWRRDGLPHATPISAGQKLWIWKAMITSVDPVEANNTFIGLNLHFSALARTKTPVVVVS